MHDIPRDLVYAWVAAWEASHPSRMVKDCYKEIEYAN